MSSQNLLLRVSMLHLPATLCCTSCDDCRSVLQQCTFIMLLLCVVSGRACIRLSLLLQCSNNTPTHVLAACAALSCAVLCHAVPCHAVLCCAVMCHAVLCCAVPCCAVLRCAALCCAVPCCAVLRRTMSCHVMSRHVMSCHVTSCHVMLGLHLVLTD